MRILNILLISLILIVPTTFAITDTLSDNQRKYPYTIGGVSYSVQFLYASSGGPDTCGFWVTLGDTDYTYGQKERVKPNGQAINVGETYQLTTFPLALTLNSCGTQASFSLVSGGSSGGGCVSNYVQKCYNNAFYYYDSCGNRQGLVTDCASLGSICTTGEIDWKCKAKCILTTQKTCVGNNVYYLDSCGQPIEEAERCPLEYTCSVGKCIKETNDIVKDVALIGVSSGISSTSTKTSQELGYELEEKTAEYLARQVDRTILNVDEAGQFADDFLKKGYSSKNVLISGGSKGSKYAPREFARRFVPDLQHTPDFIQINGKEITIIDSKLSGSHSTEQIKAFDNLAQKMEKIGFKVNKVISCNGICKEIPLKWKGKASKIKLSPTIGGEGYISRGVGFVGIIKLIDDLLVKPIQIDNCINKKGGYPPLIDEIKINSQNERIDLCNEIIDNYHSTIDSQNNINFIIERELVNNTEQHRFDLCILFYTDPAYNLQNTAGNTIDGSLERIVSENANVRCKDLEKIKKSQDKEKRRLETNIIYRTFHNLVKFFTG